MRIDPLGEHGLITSFCGARPLRSNTARPARHPLRHPPGLQLLRAVMRLAGGEAELLHHAERPWASVTFSGTRHSILLCFDGLAGVAAGEAFVAALPEHEFTISRQLVADAAIAGVTHDTLPAPRLVVEAELLLLEDS